MLTLDEAIKHCEEKAKELLKERGDDCFECAQEHMQLAMWLTELKRYRELHSFTIPNYIANVALENPTIPLACRNCSNHPFNGGSRICHCTLGSSITY